MQIPRNLSLALLVCLLVPCVGQKCLADSVVYSNLGTGADVYNGFAFSAILGSSGEGSHGLASYTAESFTPANSYHFTELEVALAYFGFGTDSVTVDLMSDAGGPGTVLESWSVSNLAAPSTCCTLQTLSGNGSILLDAGTPYWLAINLGDDTTDAGWNDNTTGASGTIAINRGSGWVLDGPVNDIGAFEVDGIPAASTIPEPSTLVLLGSGLLGFVGTLRRRRLLPASIRP